MAIRAERHSERAKREFLPDLVARLKRLPQVRRVLIEGDEGAPRVWIVIQAEPWDFSLWQSIYDAESRAMIAHPRIDADLRLVNPAEYGEVSLDEVLPPDSTPLFQR